MGILLGRVASWRVPRWERREGGERRERERERIHESDVLEGPGWKTRERQTGSLRTNREIKVQTS